MKHLNEEELIEHYYGKKSDDHPSRQKGTPDHIARHLAGCLECSADFTALESDLSDLAEFSPPHRDAEYGHRVWKSIAPQLAERPERGLVKILPARRNLWRGLAYATVAAALLAATFYAGRLWEDSKAPIVSTRPAALVPGPKPVVVGVLGDHLDRTERLLVELKHTDADDSDMFSPLREEARNLLPANRIFQHEAEKSDDPELESALSRLNGLLTQLADHPGGLDPAAVAYLQDEMRAKGLLFEIRVLRARIPAEQALSTASEGGKI